MGEPDGAPDGPVRVPRGLQPADHAQDLQGEALRGKADGEGGDRAPGLVLHWHPSVGAGGEMDRFTDLSYLREQSGLLVILRYAACFFCKSIIIINTVCQILITYPCFDTLSDSTASDWPAAFLWWSILQPL